MPFVYIYKYTLSASLAIHSLEWIPFGFYCAFVRHWKTNDEKGNDTEKKFTHHQTVRTSSAHAMKYTVFAEAYERL